MSEDSTGQVRTAAGGVNLTTNAATKLLDKSSDKAVQIAVHWFSAVNRHASQGTTFELCLPDGTGLGIIVYCAPNGGGYAGSLPQPVLIPPNTELWGKCGTSGADVVVSVLGEYAKG